MPVREDGRSHARVDLRYADRPAGCDRLLDLDRRRGRDVRRSGDTGTQVGRARIVCEARYPRPAIAASAEPATR